MHGAKTRRGRQMKVPFPLFVSYNVAHRTIIALWKARSMIPEQKVQMIEEESDTRSSLRTEESGAFLGVEDVNLSEVYSSVLSVPIDFFMEIIGGEDLELKAMEKAECHQSLRESRGNRRSPMFTSGKYVTNSISMSPGTAGR